MKIQFVSLTENFEANDERTILVNVSNIIAIEPNDKPHSCNVWIAGYPMVKESVFGQTDLLAYINGKI